MYGIEMCSSRWNVLGSIQMVKVTYYVMHNDDLSEILGMGLLSVGTGCLIHFVVVSKVPHATSQYSNVKL